MKHRYVIIIAALFSTLKLIAQPCSDLFISEYHEGSSYNKIIEIYNPTSGTIDLSAYRLQTYFNAADTPQYQMTLYGSLPSGEVWVGSNSQADSAVLALADTTNSFVINWNGNDAVVLLNFATGDTLDIIGVIGDSVLNWAVGSGSTQDHDLIRAPNVQEGTTDWSISSTQWIVNDPDVFSTFGFHVMSACAVIPDPEVFFILSDDTVSEGNNGFLATIGILNPNSNPTSVDVAAVDLTAQIGLDYDFTQNLTSFPANSSTPITVSGTIIDDILVEGDENFRLVLSNATNNATISQTEEFFMITDNDGISVPAIQQQPILIYPNPAHDVLVIKGLMSENLILKNTLGQEVKNLQVSSSQKQIIDIGDLPPGAYLLEICDSHKLIQKIVVKQ